MSPIGFFKSNQKKNYEVTRQAEVIDSEKILSLNDSSVGVIELEPGFNYEQALLGLETFSRIWVLFVFHKNSHWNTMVSPPRPPENGPQKFGVFATRSPHRPNFIGQSALQLLKIEGRKIYVLGSDLIDGTPVLDIKPYVTYADAFPEASNGWLKDVPPPYQISFSDKAVAKIHFLQNHGLDGFSKFIKEQLEYAPTQGHSKRIKPLAVNMSPSSDLENNYELSYKTWRVQFEISLQAHSIKIIDIQSGYTEMELSDSIDTYEDKEFHRVFLSTKF